MRSRKTTIVLCQRSLIGSAGGAYLKIGGELYFGIDTVDMQPLDRAAPSAAVSEQDAATV